MAVNVSNTLTTNTFEFWRNRTNQMADIITNQAVTTNSNTASGDASIDGTFSAGVLNANNTTQSSNSTTGSLTTAGGVGIKKNLHVGGTFNSVGQGTFDGTVTISGALTAANITANGALLTSVDAATLDGVDGASYLRSDADDTASAKLTISQEIELTAAANADFALGQVDLPNTANISISGMSAHADKVLKVNSDGTSLIFGTAGAANVGDIGDVQVNYGSISNADVLVYDENLGKFKNFPRSLIDVASVDDIEDVSIDDSPGELLVRVTGTTGSPFDGTSNGFITGRLDSVSETEYTSQTGNTIAYTSTSNSTVQVFVNGVKFSNADFTVSNTSHLSFTNDLESSDIVQVVEFDPHAFSVSDGTPSEAAALNFSDMRLKEDIDQYQASSTIFDIETYTYNWKDKERFHDRREIGFIAQDLEKYVPEVVTSNVMGEKMVDYGKMTAVLLSTVKQLNKRIEVLEERLSEGK